MIIEQITNKEDETALSVTECGIHIEGPQVAIHHTFEDSIEILWLIERLKFLHGITLDGERHEASQLRSKQQ